MTVAPDELAQRYRTLSVNAQDRAILLSRLADSAQEADISTPVNCNGFGRVHHFGRRHSSRWPTNPLPKAPAARALGLNSTTEIRAQVFQNAACNLRCWYCYVPFSLLRADATRSEFVPVADMVQWYLSLPDRPAVLDLSGGQPDLAPEWVPWVLAELERVDAAESVYVWSDDNLTTEFLFTELTPTERRTMRRFRNYGRVGCFKGFDEASFAFNTGAPPSLLQRQFDVMGKLIALGLDCFAYVSLTCDNVSRDLEKRVASFVDKLQRVHPLLPLRTVPLEIQPFSVTRQRLKHRHGLALHTQYDVVQVWREQLTCRFSSAELEADMCDIQLTRTS